MDAKWPILNTLGLSKNDIESEGIKHVTRANWPLLQFI
jgi:hypothetical protein